jgi:hypothetical protein
LEDVIALEELPIQNFMVLEKYWKNVSMGIFTGVELKVNR